MKTDKVEEDPMKEVRTAIDVVTRSLVRKVDEIDLLKSALKDIIIFCEQFQLSDDKKETLNEYRKLL